MLKLPKKTLLTLILPLVVVAVTGFFCFRSDFYTAFSRPEKKLLRAQSEVIAKLEEKHQIQFGCRDMTPGKLDHLLFSFIAYRDIKDKHETAEILLDCALALSECVNQNTKMKTRVEEYPVPFNHAHILLDCYGDEGNHIRSASFLAGTLTIVDYPKSHAFRHETHFSLEDALLLVSDNVRNQLNLK